MTERELFKQTFDAIHASGDTITEVMKMARTDIPYKSNRGRRVYRIALIAAAMAALLVTAAFATDFFGLRAEPVGQYGMKISADYSDGAEAEAVTATTAASSDTIAFTGGDPALTHIVTVTPGYLPEGMENVVGETRKFWFKDNHDAGFSISQHILNTGKATFCWVQSNVQSRESLTVAGHEAIWLQFVRDENGTLYISYPEYNVVLEIIFMEMDKDTALNIAKNLTVADSGEGFGSTDYYTYLYQAAAEGRDGRMDDVEETADGYVRVENSALEEYVDKDGWTVTNNGNDIYKTTLSKDEMNSYAVGESFPMRFPSEAGYVTLDMKVTDVSVADDLSILTNPSLADSDLTGLLDEKGKLPMNTVKYIKSGDGINSLDTVVATEEHALKLVAVTMDITNNTGRNIDDILFYGELLAAEDSNDGYVLRHDPFETALPDGTAYDYKNGGNARTHDMAYYSIHGTVGDGGNHIDRLAAGETVTLQMAWLVNDDDVPCLYLDMNGTSRVFDRDSLEQGYVRLFE